MFSGGTAALNYYYRLTLKSGGNLVEYKILPNQSTTSVVWQTGTGSTPRYLVLNSYGNVILYDTNGKRVWQSGTAGIGVTHLGVTSDGNMRLLTGGGAAKWASRWAECSKAAITNGKASTPARPQPPVGGTRIARSNLRPGDLVFFYGADAPHPGHVGIYIGKGYLIDAFDTGYKVTIHSLSWENQNGSHDAAGDPNYMGAVRYW